MCIRDRGVFRDDLVHAFFPFVEIEAVRIVFERGGCFAQRAVDGRDMQRENIVLCRSSLLRMRKDPAHVIPGLCAAVYIALDEKLVVALLDSRHAERRGFCKRTQRRQLFTLCDLTAQYRFCLLYTSFAILVAAVNYFTKGKAIKKKEFGCKGCMMADTCGGVCDEKEAE